MAKRPLKKDFSKEPVKEEIKEPVDEPVKQPEPKIGKVANCNRLRIRKKPSTKADIIKVINAGDKVNIKAELDAWFRIDEGYVMKDFIEVK